MEFTSEDADKNDFVDLPPSHVRYSNCILKGRPLPPKTSSDSLSVAGAYALGTLPRGRVRIPTRRSYSKSQKLIVYL